MTDAIDRQAAIDAIQQHRENVLGGYEYDEGVAFVYAAAHNHIIDVIERLPSVQPDLQPTCNQLATDCISKQAAIEVIDAVFPVDPMKSEYAQGIACGAALAKTYVEQLPSVQLEQEYTMEEFMYGQDMGNPEDGSL